MDLTRALFNLTAGFPKRLRASLTERIELLTVEVLELLTRAAYERDKRRTLADVDDGLNRLRVLIRLAHELGCLSDHQYGDLAGRMAEAGRLVGGLRRRPAAEVPLDVQPE